MKKWKGTGKAYTWVGNFDRTTMWGRSSIRMQKCMKMLWLKSVKKLNFVVEGGVINEYTTADVMRNLQFEVRNDFEMAQKELCTDSLSD